MLKRSLWAAALAVGLSSHACAQQFHAQGQRMMLVDEAGRPITAANALPVTGGGGSSGGSVTAAGASGTQAQAVQGITGGVPQNVANGGTFAVQNTAAIPAGNNLIGKVASDVTVSTGGMTTLSRVVSAAAGTNATSAKASAGRVYKITGFNAAASIRWLKLYNKASAPAVGTDTPFFQLPLPPGAFSFDAQDIGYSFGTGIAYAITTGAADTDATALTAGDILNLNVWYQ